MCLHCLTQDPLRRPDDCRGRYWAHSKTPGGPDQLAQPTPASVLAESTGASSFINRGSKRRMQFIIPLQNTKFFSLLILSVCQSSWEFILGDIFLTQKASACRYAFIYCISLTAADFMVFFWPNIATFLFLLPAVMVLQDRPPRNREQTKYLFILIWILPLRARGIKVSFYFLRPPCFHYLKRGCVYASTKTLYFFFLHCKNRHVDSVW